MSSNGDSFCKCSKLIYDTCSHGTKAGYKRPSETDRKQASGKGESSPLPDPRAFPGPLVLPGDDLAWDPEWPAQNFAEWRDEEERNAVTYKRKVIYIAAPPIIDSEVEFVASWTKPVDGKFERKDGNDGESSELISEARTKDVAEYIAAFYHPLPVKVLKNRFHFTAWEDGTSNSKKSSKSKSGKSHASALPKYIGFNNTKECIRIETRATRDGIFVRQLNLNDIIDGLISMLPKDAYSIVLLVDHDIYEGPEDDFCCGRAYGGSRVGVISAARYNPILDVHQNVELRHAWPASHCGEYVEKFIAETEARPQKKPKKTAAKGHPGSSTRAQDVAFPIGAAVDTYLKTLSPSGAPVETASNLWYSRVCRTVSHELGHCFGMDHCVYYACVMQGTASASEDIRQPPYLCPIDLDKVLAATGADIRAHYQKLLEFCQKYSEASLFNAYRAWLESRLISLTTDTTPAKSREVILISP